MHTEITTETLKTGETLHIECVTAPDAEREEQIMPFLGHKGGPWQKHITDSFAGQCDGLETRYYIGLLDGQMVGNIMTVESHGVGILGHVHTRSDQRRKGIASSIMQHQMEDFRRRNGHVLLLGTGYQSAAYWIYHQFGFRDLEGASPGTMRYAVEPDFESRFFAPAPGRPEPATWRHWPLVALLSSVPGPSYLRSLALDVWGVHLLEGPYCRFMAETSGRPDTRAAVLAAENGAVTAMATCLPDSRRHGDGQLLDLFAHPNARRDDLAALLRSLPLPDAPMQAYAEPRDTEKVAALEACGFQRTAVLPEQYRDGATWQDVWLYARRSGENARE
jgi:GNAT superfamily N-acetyltransferase